MPAYGSNPGIYSVGPGDRQLLLNAEQLGTNKTSVAVAIQQAAAAAKSRSISVEFNYASVPGSVSYDIQAANKDVDSDYRKIGNTTNVNGDRVDIAMGSFNFNFIRVKELTSPGVNATVEVLG